jgi:hypothetical protein
MEQQGFSRGPELCRGYSFYRATYDPSSFLDLFKSEYSSFEIIQECHFMELRLEAEPGDSEEQVK